MKEVGLKYSRPTDSQLSDIYSNPDGFFCIRELGIDNPIIGFAWFEEQDSYFLFKY